MNTPMRPIDESDLMKLAIEEKERPFLTATRHAGWLLVNHMSYYSEQDGYWKFFWLASNNVTGRIVGFITMSDEPEPCYEGAAESFVDSIEETLS